MEAFEIRTFYSRFKTQGSRFQGILTFVDINIYEYLLLN